MEGHPGPGLRIAAVADVHCSKSSHGRLASLFREMAAEAEVILLCGDLTDYGLVDEAKILADELRAAHHGTVLAVLGNHDYESDQAEGIKQALSDADVRVLDGESCEIRGVGFAGVKGFMGGFGARTLQAWGERATKAVVRETVEEALKLETALSRLSTPVKIVALHYAPIEATVVGEPADIFPFLGCSRLEEPCDRYGVSAVFHGHAHHGAPQGKTSKGVPVFNVALPVLKRAHPQRPTFALWEAPIIDENAEEERPAERPRQVLHPRPHRA